MHSWAARRQPRRWALRTNNLRVSSSSDCDRMPARSHFGTFAPFASSRRGHWRHVILFVNGRRTIAYFRCAKLARIVVQIIFHRIRLDWLGAPVANDGRRELFTAVAVRKNDRLTGAGQPAVTP